MYAKSKRYDLDEFRRHCRAQNQMDEIRTIRIPMYKDIRGEIIPHASVVLAHEVTDIALTWVITFDSSEDLSFEPKNPIKTKKRKSKRRRKKFKLQYQCGVWGELCWSGNQNQFNFIFLLLT